MKHGIAFFSLLLIFSQCTKVAEAPSGFAPDRVDQTGLKAIQPPQKQHYTGFIDSLLKSNTRSHRKVSKKKARKSELILTRESAEAIRLNADSLRIQRLNYLRSAGIDIDLNEPVSREYLESPVANQKFPTMITLSRESFLRINFDNDILDYTDRFFTNGIRIDLISPGLQMNPLGKLMVPYWGSGTNFYGLTLVQNMYTPSTTKTGGILYGDRPYAAYLYLGSFKITNDPAHRFRQTTELDIGIIGPNSYGEWVQRSFHNSVPSNNEPLGWEFQVQNDLVLNYAITYEKGIFSGKNYDFNLISIGKVGTLYTNFSGGFLFRTGWLNPYFANLGIARKSTLAEQGLRKFQLIFFLKGAGKLVGYDATLEGGLFNQTSAYTLPPDEISRIVFQGSGGISISAGGFRFDMEQFLLSPDFQNGWWHKWVHVALAFSL